MAFLLCKIYGSMHSARVIYYAMYSSEHSTRLYSLRNIYAANIQKGVGDQFIAPASSTKTIGCNLQNITDCNAYGRNKIWEKQCCVTICMTMLCKKPPFCAAKVWFLACKKGVFTLQKYGFCNAKREFLFFGFGTLTMLRCISCFL